MTLQELITDLKAAGANENTMQLAMNCYELGLANARNSTWTQTHWTEYEHSIAAAEREACAKYLDQQNTAMTDKLAAAIRARGTQ